jgi:hypothetical protein
VTAFLLDDHGAPDGLARSTDRKTFRGMACPTTRHGLILLAFDIATVTEEHVFSGRF